MPKLLGVTKLMMNRQVKTSYPTVLLYTQLRLVRGQFSISAGLTFVLTHT